MKRISLRKLAVAFSAALAGTYGLALACGFSDEFDWLSSFTPEAYVNKSYSPLFYEPVYLFYAEDGVPEKNSRFNDQIINDWSTYFNGKLTAGQLSQLMLGDGSSALVQDLHTAIANKRVSHNLNGFDINDAKVVSAVEFLWNAKIIERNSTRELNSWDYQSKPKNATDEITPAIKRIEKLYLEAKDPFLKNRYWFQIIKGHFYSAHPENLIAFYEQTQSTAPKNTLYYRALGYLAGVYYAKKDYHQSNYLYSVTFDKCEALRADAGFGFHPMEAADMIATLALGKTTDEKCAIWALSGFYQDEQKAINEIYKLNPASPHLDYLLTRLVNKFEYSNENFEASGSKAFVEKMAVEGKVSNRYLWYSAAGYLNIFGGDSTSAGRLLREAAKYCPKEESAVAQLRLLTTINFIAGIKKVESSTERKLLSSFKELGVDNGLRKELAVKWARQHLADVYSSVHKNVVLAQIFKYDQQFFTSNENCESMKAFLVKPNKSEWEKYVASLSQVTVAEIYEFQAIQKALVQDLDQAISLMAMAGEGSSTELLGNPFNGKIKDCHDCDHAATQKVKYNKLSYLKKMKEMQNSISAKSEVYNNALLLGNAYYNMTFYGNARVFYASKISDGIFGIEKQPSDCSAARKYYQLAFSAAVDDEQRAKCTYLLSKCERNDYYTGLYGTDYFYEPKDDDFKAWQGFVKLKNEYAHTQYYKDVIRECGYFASWAEK